MCIFKTKIVVPMAWGSSKEDLLIYVTEDSLMNANWVEWLIFIQLSVHRVIIEQHRYLQEKYRQEHNMKII